VDTRWSFGAESHPPRGRCGTLNYEYSFGHPALGFML
jgi:hypothetical protein